LLGARRSTPCKADTEVNHVIAATCIVVDGFEPIEKEFIAVTEIQKRAVMHKELYARLWSNRPSRVSIVPYQTNESPEIWNNDVC